MCCYGNEDSGDPPLDTGSSLRGALEVDGIAYGSAEKSQ